jgi:hypothetical protein
MNQAQPSAIGTQRRLRALMNRAWAPEMVERVDGIPAAETPRAPAQGRTISPELGGQRVAIASDQLWNQGSPRQRARTSARPRSSRPAFPPARTRRH